MNAYKRFSLGLAIVVTIVVVFLVVTGRESPSLLAFPAFLLLTRLAFFFYNPKFEKPKPTPNDETEP